MRNIQRNYINKKMEKKIYLIAIAMLLIVSCSSGCIKSAAKNEKTKVNINSAKGAQDDSGIYELNFAMNNNHQLITKV
jgi:hypothetical protein